MSLLVTATETRYEVEDQLTGVLAETRVTHRILTTQIAEFRALQSTIKRVPLSGVTSTDGSLGWNENTLYKSNEPFRHRESTTSLVAGCSLLITIAPRLLWLSDEDVVTNGHTVSDRDTWAELIVMAAEIERTDTQVRNLKKECNRLSKILRADDIRHLHGYYVKVINSRRTMVGWIDKGRGKSTIYVTPDPLAECFLDDTTAADLARMAWSATIQGRAILHGEDKMSWTDSTSITVILPPDMARIRRGEVADFLNIAMMTKADAEKQAEAAKTWQDEHQALVRRRDEVNQVSRQFEDYDPTRVETIINTSVKVWMAEAIRLFGDSITEATRHKMLTEVGGPLTVAEEKELAEAPAGPADLGQAWRAAMAEKFAKPLAESLAM